MASFSIGAAWDEMIAFVRQENGIVTPVSMATFGVGAVLLSFVMPNGMAQSATPAVSARLLLIVPAMLAVVLGNLSLSVLALSPGTSVADALRRAVSRLPVMVGAAILLGLILLGILLITSIIVAPFAGNITRATAILTPLVAFSLIAVSAPSLLLPPIVAMEPVSPLGALKRVIALARGNVGRLLAVLCLAMLVMMTVSLIATVVVTVVTKLLASLLGQPALVSLVGDILLAGISALLSMSVALYVAFVYRRLAG